MDVYACFFITSLIIKDSFYINKNKHHENSDFLHPPAKLLKVAIFYILNHGG